MIRLMMVALLVSAPALALELPPPTKVKTIRVVVPTPSYKRPVVKTPEGATVTVLKVRTR